MMTDNESYSKKRKRSVTIGVDDMYTLFQRYTESTIIALYQEIAKFCGQKIEWKELVKRTSTGIKNAREYQMLWRHLAYRHPLQEKIEDGAEPPDDESDLETELEATPLENAKILAAAQACTEVLLASRPPSINISHHVSSPKRPSYAFQSSNDLATTGGNPLSKAKKNMWSREDDSVLIDGVKKCGEGNWTTISRELFNGQRNASQVGWRWKLLKDKHYPGSNSAGSNVNRQQVSNELAATATRKAISMALKMPVTSTSSSAGTTPRHKFAPAVSKKAVTNTCSQQVQDHSADVKLIDHHQN